jgi:hypothetical protein
MEEMRICRKCNLELPLTEYYYENGNPKWVCKKCSNEITKVYRKQWKQTTKGKESIKKSKKKYKEKISEKNRILKEERKKQRDLAIQQKEIKKQERIVKRELKEQKKEEYRKLMEYYNSDEWKEIKKQKEKERQHKKWKRKWNEDEMFVMKVRLRNLIRNSFRKKGYSKFNISTEEIVGINYEEFKKYLESKFLNGMSWNNRGEWHIDHIIPLSSAKSKDELISLCHYLNLQPLWARDNLEKGNK